jgi:hypothetical protein
MKAGGWRAVVLAAEMGRRSENGPVKSKKGAVSGENSAFPPAESSKTPRRFFVLAAVEGSNGRSV